MKTHNPRQSTAADGLFDTEQEQMVSARPSTADPVSGSSSGPPSKKIAAERLFQTVFLKFLKPFQNNNGFIKLSGLLTNNGILKKLFKNK
ncbi:hypothetical protein RN001_015944 [Aquatica leii]|uniref:Uncharacterized protein n=1 Tax=Aquatica leii TaxID=1421715 RepID=A0AAN7PXW4_9COLE|nr:hypothetical protein RN001_015944 [Aquatica leii]